MSVVSGQDENGGHEQHHVNMQRSRWVIISSSRFTEERPHTPHVHFNHLQCNHPHRSEPVVELVHR